MILIYSPEENPRVTWTFEILFKSLLGVDYRITTFPGELEHEEGPKLCYSFKPMGDFPWIRASGLLFERDIHDLSASLIPRKWEGLPTIFANDEDEFAGRTQRSSRTVDFDIFSAVFYFVSRYEEYLPYEPDAHNRFHSSESLAFHLNLIEEPIVNQWANAFGTVLTKLFGENIRIKKPDYQYISTIDIDNAWAYAHKGIRRFLGGFWRDRRNMEARNFRVQVLRENQPDPFDTYALLEHFNQEAGIKPIWFFLLGDPGPFDKNISPGNRHFQNLIRRIASEYPSGIHPSYGSTSSASMIQKEIQRLARITGQPVTRSRQHYLRIHLPDTYRTLSHMGIAGDYSMGFADRPGFRAGISVPFRFFDLEENKSTDLTVYPFQVMDTGLRQYLGLNPDEALEKILSLADKVRKTGGTFITLWHNESLSEWKEWTGWSEVYRQMVKELSSE